MLVLRLKWKQLLRIFLPDAVYSRHCKQPKRCHLQSCTYPPEALFSFLVEVAISSYFQILNVQPGGGLIVYPVNYLEQFNPKFQAI